MAVVGAEVGDVTPEAKVLDTFYDVEVQSFFTENEHKSCPLAVFSDGIPATLPLRKASSAEYAEIFPKPKDAKQIHRNPDMFGDSGECIVITPETTINFWFDGVKAAFFQALDYFTDAQLAVALFTSDAYTDVDALLKKIYLIFFTASIGVSFSFSWVMSADAFETLVAAGGFARRRRWMMRMRLAMLLALNVPIHAALVMARPDRVLEIKPDVVVSLLTGNVHYFVGLTANGTAIINLSLAFLFEDIPLFVISCAISGAVGMTQIAAASLVFSAMGIIWKAQQLIKLWVHFHKSNGRDAC